MLKSKILNQVQDLVQHDIFSGFWVFTNSSPLEYWNTGIMEWSSQKDWSSRSLPSWPSPPFFTRVEKMLIGIPLVFNFTPLSNFSLFLFQAKVLHRRITNWTNNNGIRLIRCHSAYSQRKFLSDRSSIVSKWIPLWNLNGISSIAKIIDKPFLLTLRSQRSFLLNKFFFSANYLNLMSSSKTR